MDIRVDRESRTPIHVQVTLRIKELILKGALPEGGRLPPTRKLAKTLGVNRSTVVAAYENLWAEGLVESHVGRGTTVKATTETDLAPCAPLPWAALFAARAEGLELQVRDFSKLLDRRDLISLAAGLPAPDLYPMEELTRIADEVIRRSGRELLHWCSLEGLPSLRKTLAQRLEGASAGEVIILSGSTQGIFLLARTFIQPGDVVVVEAPTYLGAITAFKAAGARVVGIPVDSDGIDLRMLENTLTRTSPKFLYVQPSFQNPSGVTMGLERRRLLLETAYRHGIPVVEDDAYAPLRYEGERLPCLKELDTHGYVIYLSTFTKILFPGLRIGWMLAPKRVIEQIAPAKHMLDLFTNSVGQAMVHEFIRRGLLEEHLERVRGEYRQRRDMMAVALKRYCPALTFDIPHGGYFFWCHLPRGMSAREILREALRLRVSFIPGDIFYPDGRGQDRIRLTFASQPPEVIEEASKNLGRAIRRLKRQRTRREEDVEPVARPVL